MVYLLLFFNAFISATLFPLGSEALLIYNLTQGYNLYALLFFATLGNSLGSLVNYYLGLKGEEFLVEKKLLNKNHIEKSKIYFDKYGGFTLLFSWLPILGDPLTFIAGILRYDIKKFIILVVIAKFSRYAFIAMFI